MSGPTAFQQDAFQADAFQVSTVTSTRALQLPVDYYMEDLPQYSATGRTFERVKGKAGKKVVFAKGAGGRIAGPAPSSKTVTNSRGYD